MSHFDEHPDGTDTLIKIEALVQRSQELTDELKAVFQDLRGEIEDVSK